MQQFMDAFQAEAAGLIDQLEQHLLRLEKTPDDAEAIRQGFQAAHSLKGAAAMLDLQDVRTLTHAMESVLQLGREASLSSGHVAPLLDALDLLRDLLEQASAGQSPDPRTPEMAARLNASLQSPPETLAPAQSLTQSPATATALAPHSPFPLALLVEPSPLAAEVTAWHLEQLGYRVERRDSAERLPDLALAVIAGAAAKESDLELLHGLRWTVVSEKPDTRAFWASRQITALPRPALNTPLTDLPSSWIPK